MTALEQNRKTWAGKSDEWLFERLNNELKDKVETIHKLLTENEQLRLCGVVKSLPSKHDMWEERGKQVVKLEESNTSFSKHTPHLLGFTLGFEKCYEWLAK